MSLISVAQTVADEVGIDAPSSVIGSEDRTAKQLLRLINREGRILAKRRWTVLQKENTFTTDGTAYVALPSDFGYLLAETVWDRDNYWQLRGNLSAGEWQVYKSGLVSSPSTRLRFRVRPLSGVNKLYFDPTPASGVDGVFEYVSSKWATDSGGSSFKTKYEVDTDVSLIAEELIELGAIWRFKAAKGLGYGEDYNTYTREVEAAFARDGAKPVLRMGGPVRNDWRMNIPETGYGQ